MRDLFSIIRRAPPPQTAATGGRDPIAWLMACGAFLIAAIIVGTVMMVAEFRERALSNSERELENTIRLLARHFDQQFDDCAVITNGLISQLRLSEIDSPDAFREQVSTTETYQMLSVRSNVSSLIGDINIYDANGRLVNSSNVSPALPFNVSDRRYFEIFKSNPNAPAVVIEPGHDPDSKRWTTVIAHRLTGRNGIFLGVLTRSVDPVNYEKFLASVVLGPSASIALFHTDGTMLARYPHNEAMIGRDFRAAPVVQPVLEKGGLQALQLTSPIDGSDRLGAGARLERYPIVIVATNTVAAALADWRAQTRFMIVAAALAAAVVAVLVVLIIRLINRQNQDAQQRLEEQKRQVDTALNNMTHGLVLYDATARIVTFNKRYIDMYNLSTDVVKPGLHYYDLIQHRKDTGSFDGDVRDFCDPIMRDVSQGRTNHSMMELGDGRAFLIANKPLAQGGWVATIEDVTERRKLEHERDRNNAFLRELIDHIPSQIAVKDAHDRRYVLVNSATEKNLGLSRSEIIGKTPFDLFDEAVAERVVADDDKALASTEALFIDEHCWESRSLGPRFIVSRRLAIRDRAGEARYIVNVVEDVTERRQANEKIAHLAHYDALTDLPNRVLFRAQIERELRQANQGRQFALLYIDIDEFKGINDSLGHHVGDELLKTVASRIRDCIKQDDLIARLGGDEFAVIQTGVAAAADVETFVARIYEAIRRPCECLGHQLSTDASIGVAIAPRDGTELDQLIKHADLAMYAAKSSGRRVHRFFEPAMDASANARLTMEQDLRHALTDGGFEIHYQPLVSLASGDVTGCEALLRWRHPDRGMISPAEFIPVAEDTGLINEIGDWVLRTACAEAATWPAQVRLAVNVSPVQFKSGTLALKIMAALAASNLPAERLELEITEAVLIRDDEAALAILHRLRAIGVRIALDDFGTGYSSLSYLKRFPFDKIKIDRCFVSDINEADGSSSIVQAVVNIAAALHMTTAAEGVETEAQRALLRKLGCTEMQGYLFSAARPSAEVKALFAAPRGRAVVVA
jgi:diguanylate cyclase (GGDEF)-like protein/PAS domain S-box-containing protein